MTTKDQLLIGFVIVLGIGALPIGLAVARTWNATLTAVALVGIIGALLIAASSVGSAAGISWHDRRTTLAPPSIRMDAPPSTGVPYLDAMTAAQLRALDAQTLERTGRAELSRFGMEPREIPIRDWRAAAQTEDDGGWGE